MKQLKNIQETDLQVKKIIKALEELHHNRQFAGIYLADNFFSGTITNLTCALDTMEAQETIK